MISSFTVLSSLDHPSLLPYRTLKRPLDHQRQGIFVAEGEKVVRRLVESKLLVISILLTQDWFSTYEPLVKSRPEQIEVFVADQRLLEQIVGIRLHQGIMAVAKNPSPISLEEMFSASPSPHFFVALDGIANAENLGAIVRNCVSFNVQLLIVGETSADPYLRRAVRNSMGTVFRLPVCYAHDLTTDLEALKKKGIMVLAADPKPHERFLHSIDFSKDCCIVFGSEGDGISKRVLEVCDERVTIPMQEGIDSLNVASANAVVLYEVMRRRMI
jgi:tRNA G18 (ribose-2'-O)-methylase SpoU